MGITGTDVTKGVADMVLADDNFATIVGAVEEGRRIYNNIRKAIQFLLGSNMSEVISIFAATLMGFTILQPVHLLWINLVTDCFPALALGMEPAEPDIKQQRPRSAKAGHLRRRHGRGHRLSGPARIGADAGLLLHRALHRVRRMGDRQQRGRHDDGVFDHEPCGDLPQLQHAHPAREPVLAQAHEQDAQLGGGRQLPA